MPCCTRVCFHSVFLFTGSWISAIVLLCISSIFPVALFSSVPPTSRGSVCHRLTYILYKFSVISFKYFFAFNILYVKEIKEISFIIHYL